MGVIKILKMVLKYSSGTIIAFQDFFHQHEFGCWWRTHHHLRQTPRSRRHPFFIQSFFTLNTSLGQITLEDYFEMVRNVSQFHNCSIHWLSLKISRQRWNSLYFQIGSTNSNVVSFCETMGNPTHVSLLWDLGLNHLLLFVIVMKNWTKSFSKWGYQMPIC